MTTPLLSLDGISKRFVKRLDFAGRLVRRLGGRRREETVHAIDGVDLAVGDGEVVGLVGESGSGKSTLGRIAAGVLEPTEGTIHWRGADRGALPSTDRRAALLDVQMIFQDPMSSLNPRLRVADIVGEAPVVHGQVSRAQIGDFVDDLLQRVGLDASYKRRYPHQFSGGQRARIGIARALAVKPKMLVADESVAALDVSIQAQVLNLFMRLRDELKLTYLFISHDLGVIHHVADRVAVMYLGRIVESGPVGEVFARPNHPYTQALIAEVPRLEVGKRKFRPVEGEIPSPLAPPPGCHFHPRCPRAMARCEAERPALREIAPLRISACHLNDGR